MQALELLAPARTADIGIAAIDCGADAVYIAGPAFGARQAAGNSVEDIGRLCTYAHRFGARIFATVNTLVYEEELPVVRQLVQNLAQSGVDALIVQDPAVIEMARGTGMALHASTQCAIREPEKARFTESLGYGRLVLERQLSLDEIKAISSAVEAEIEFFVHGALCVCYSGQCYLSEYLTGRSANRGACAQPCRNLYDLEDASGKVLVRNKALLSLKDYNLLHRLEALAEAGVQSFKIEGRLKGETYVRNVVRAYSEALDALVARHPWRYCRASFGRVSGGFSPDLQKTFNRGYTELFIEGKRGKWASMEAPKSMGEFVGTVNRITANGLVLNPVRPDLKLTNGDGFAFVEKDGSITGFRADACDGFTLRCKRSESLQEGTRLYRNISAAFEKAVASGKPLREMAVSVQVDVSPERLIATARTEDGRWVSTQQRVDGEAARDPEALRESIYRQIGKRAGYYAFQVSNVALQGAVPFLGAAFLNGIRRALAELLEQESVHALPLRHGTENASVRAPEVLSYKANVSNSAQRALYAARGASKQEDAYELNHRPGVELMRSKYCIRHELGLCPKQQKSAKVEPLYLLNGGQRLRLDFHCPECEMTLSAESCIQSSHFKPGMREK